MDSVSLAMGALALFGVGLPVAWLLWACPVPVWRQRARRRDIDAD